MRPSSQPWASSTSCCAQPTQQSVECRGLASAGERTDDDDGEEPLPGDLSEDDVMRELDAVAEDDEAQLIAFARQLKRAWRA